MGGANVEEVFIAAAKALRLVRLTEPGGRERVVEPYMIFRSGTGKRLLHAFQLGGYSAGGVVRGWKNAEVTAFDGAEMVEQRFLPRRDYNPFNEERFPGVLFAVPTREGRQRARDALE